MKSVLVLLAMIASFTFSTAAQAQQQYDREYAYLKLLDMGYDIPVEEMGEMFKHGIFILVNPGVCSDLGASLWDDNGSSCLLQVKDNGEIGGFESTNPNALYE